jgi:G3E family GTPase
MNMEAIITVVGFLGAGKTTLLKELTTNYMDNAWNPFIILNDYENAYLDAQQFIQQAGKKSVVPLSGSCICCSGIHELRDFVNRIPEREKGITLIEANGTTDACSLMGFLGVGLEKRFSPPIQVSVVDVKNWQKRDEHNSLEANQVQLSSLIILSHTENVSEHRKSLVIKMLQKINPLAQIVLKDELDISILPQLLPSKNKVQKLDHTKSHWSSCSIDLPILPDSSCIYTICNTFPKSILRVKGCAQVGDNKAYTYFERTPDGQVHVRPFNGDPPMGAKLLTVGLGSEPSFLEKVVKNSLQTSM